MEIDLGRLVEIEAHGAHLWLGLDQLLEILDLVLGLHHLAHRGSDMRNL